MTTWIIISWVLVALLTSVNIFVFLKLKKASDQMMKMAFPQSKNMGDAVAQMQKMMGGMGGMGGGAGNKGMPSSMQQPNLQQMMAQMGGKDMQAQMKAAMDMLSKMQNKR